MTRIEPAPHEEHAFAAKVNAALKNWASVSPFCKVDDETQATTYGLVFSCGSKRKVIEADSPWSYDSVDDVVARVRKWMEGAPGELYSSDPKYAE